ncbi:MAG: ribose-phosphate diphosphokinase [Chlamydiales bacterium]|nr:ribose-phosphate diphosphokinase [Chlamydiales bacterium]
MTAQDNYLIFSGSSHLTFAQEVCSNLDKSLGKLEIKQFPDGEIGVQILENVRGRDVFVLQTITQNPNFYLMEILILIDALKRASAKSITAVLPYYGYCRQDRRAHGREPISAKLVANLLETAGIDRLLTMDLHADQIEGFFNVPVDNLFARPVLIDTIRAHMKQEFVIVAPDLGSIKIAKRIAEALKKKLAIINKRRIDAEHVQPEVLIGDVQNMDVLLVDDMCVTGETLYQAAKVCKSHGARNVYATVTHLLKAISPELESCIEACFVCNTTSIQDPSPKVKIVSVAKIFSAAISSVVYSDSISSIFKNE